MMQNPARSSGPSIAIPPALFLPLRIRLAVTFYGTVIWARENCPSERSTRCATVSFSQSLELKIRGHEDARADDG